MTDRELMQQALEALESDPISHAGLVSRKQAIAALRQALVDADDTSQERVDEKAKREHEPVAFRNKETGEFCTGGFMRKEWSRWTPLYSAPPKRDLTCVCGAVWEGEMMVHPPRKREWVGLADEKKIELWNKHENHWRFEDNLMAFTRDIEAKLKEKNHG